MTVFSLSPERPQHASAIEQLHADAFGPGRFARAAFRLREQGPHEMALSFVAIDADGSLTGSVRLTPIVCSASGHCGYLLGPLAVAPNHKNQGIGRALVRRAVEAATETDASFVLLVGDAPYYGPLGFEIVTSALSLPGPVDPNRLLVDRLGERTSLEALAGEVRHQSAT